MHVARCEPAILRVAIDAVRDRAHRALFIADEAMTRGEIAVGGDAEVSRAGAARIWTMRAAMNLAHRVRHVREWITITGDETSFEFGAAIDHRIEHYLE